MIRTRKEGSKLATYDEWNAALTAYTVSGVPAGAPVFLSTDEDTIARVGRHARTESASRPAEAIITDFLWAVRKRVVDGARVRLGGLHDTDVHGRPRCAGFLAAMVLAASRMRDSGDMDDVNYFGRLRDVLGLPAGNGRPDGMRFGSEAEEPLWRLWNFWVQTQGRLPTAAAGPDGPLRYVNYARTQALLRGVDQDRLVNLFRERNWRTELDAQTLLARVGREAPYLTIQLRDLLASGSHRREAVAEAMHVLYEQWRLDPNGQTLSTGTRGRTLYAGLYRVADALSGEPTYYLYPRAPRGNLIPDVGVEFTDGLRTLRPERPGWFHPVMPLSEAQIENGERWRIIRPVDMEALVLMRRAFWALIPDPDDLESTVRASWGQPQLGIPFTLLCRSEALGELRSLEQESMIAWHGEPVPVLGGRWVELRECVAISEAWSGAHATDSDLYDALRPADRCNTSLTGGLRLPGGGGWLDGVGPKVAVYGFAADAEVRITNVTYAQTEHMVLERAQETGEPRDVRWPGPGIYRVDAVCAGQDAQPRLVTIHSWDELRAASEVAREPLELPGALVLGAAVD